MYTTTEVVIVVIILLVVGAIYWLRTDSGFNTNRYSGGRSRARMDGGRTCTIYFKHGCHYCDEIMGPAGAWTRLKKNGEIHNDVTFIEHDEKISPTPSIMGYPTIIMSENGVERIYPGGNDYNKLKKFVYG